MMMMKMMMMRGREREEVWALRVETWVVAWIWWGCVSRSSSTQQRACPISHHPSLLLMEYAGKVYTFMLFSRLFYIGRYNIDDFRGLS